MTELRPDLPRWRQVHAIIKGRIESGEYAAGDRIPSLVALIGEFNIANITAQKVMRQLRADGLIRTEPGMGSYVVGPSEREG